MTCPTLLTTSVRVFADLNACVFMLSKELHAYSDMCANSKEEDIPDHRYAGWRAGRDCPRQLGRNAVLVLCNTKES